MESTAFTRENVHGHIATLRPNAVGIQIQTLTGIMVSTEIKSRCTVEN